ncbi:hypothetical protein [Pontibacterium sp.]|uniref:hypothetical protein n=1 Tax=Pontibacterium sp. TaxID=2036026 RepID=UPI003516E0C9
MKLDSAGLHQAVANQLSSNRTQPATPQTADEAQKHSVTPSTDTVTLSSGSAVSDVTSDYTAFQGKERILLVEHSEKAQRMESVLDRLSDDQQDTLIDSEVIESEAFLALAEQLGDQQLGQLANTLEGLRTLPRQGGFYAIIQAGQSPDRLLSALSELDGSTRARVLEKTEQLAAHIPPRDTSDTYSPIALNLQATGSPAASDLHSFVHAVGESENVSEMLDSLDSFSETQQSGLLNVLGKDTALGERLMDQLAERGNAAKDTAINFLGDLAASVDHHFSQAIAKTPSPLGDIYAAADHDNQSADTLLGMLESSVSLLENFEFSDEQVVQMNNQLSSIDRSDQRAYLAITETGLDQLVGADSDNPADLEDNAEAVSVIDGLRSDATVRDAVFMSRMGEEKRVDGKSFFEVKSDGTGERDQEGLISVLATDAWVNRNNDDVDISVRAMHLSENLQAMGAEARDRQVHDLNRLTQQQVPLAELSDEYLQEDTQDFMSHTNALANTLDVEALQNTALSFGPDLSDAFWQAAGMAGEEVDQFVELLDEIPVDMGEKMLHHLSERHEQLTIGEVAGEEGRESVHELINFFESNLRDEDRQRFLEGL